MARVINLIVYIFSRLNMTIKKNFNIEHIGRVISIAGFFLCGVSLIGYFYFKDELRSINSSITSIDSSAVNIENNFNIPIQERLFEQRICNKTRQSLDRCDSVSVQKRREQIDSLRAQRDSLLKKNDKPLPALLQSGRRTYRFAQTFFYSSIFSLVIAIAGILMIFGRSLAFINRAGDITVDKIIDSKVPIISDVKQDMNSGTIYPEVKNMGDKYTVYQAAAVGPNAHAHDMTLNQNYDQIDNSINLLQLTKELSTLQEAMIEEASTTEHRIAIGDVAKAEQAAEINDSAKVREHLKSAGKWSLDIATKIGVPVAIEALKKSLEII